MLEDKCRVRFWKKCVAKSSPFYIENLWTFESYRIRARYRHLLFSERVRQYRWSKWHGPFRLESTSLPLYQPNEPNAPDQANNIGNNHHFFVETLNHNQLCEWIEVKFFGNVLQRPVLINPDSVTEQTGISSDIPNGLTDDEESEMTQMRTISLTSDQHRNLTVNNSKLENKQICSTPQERESVLPIVLNVIRKSRLEGADIVLREPVEYVPKSLMSVYSEIVPDSDHDENGDDQKEVPQLLTRAISTREALRSSIILLIRDQGILNKKIDHSISDQELEKILNLTITQALMKKRGLNLEEIRMKLFGYKASESNGRLVLNEHDFESVIWRLRQIAFTETNHPIGALIDNPYCIYIWVYFHRKPRFHYAIHPVGNDVFIPLQLCLDTSEVHLYSAKYFTRSNPSELDISFYLCEKNNETGNLKGFKVDGEWIRFHSEKRKHIVLRVYNDGDKWHKGDDDHGNINLIPIQMPQQDYIRKVKDMKNWNKLHVPTTWTIRSKCKGSELPYFECLLQFCFTNIGRRVSLSACIDVIESMMLIQMAKNKGDEGVQMIIEKVEAQKRWIQTFYEMDNRSWVHFLKFVFYLYWILYTNQWQHTILFDHNMITMDILQRLLGGEYGPQKGVICILRTILHPVSERFIKVILRAIDQTHQDLSLRYQYLLWYNLINSICFNGYYQTLPKLSRNVNDFKLESEFIRMIQIDVNIHLITRVERTQFLEEEGFWILCSAMSDAEDEAKFQIYNKMCCILSVFKSVGYSKAVVRCKPEIHQILCGQEGPLEASVGLFHMLQPEKNKDVIALVDLIVNFVPNLDPSKHKSDKNALHKLVELMGSHERVACHFQLIQGISRNLMIRWREEIIVYLVPMLNDDRNKELREILYDEFWRNYNMLKVVKCLIGEHGLCIETFIKLIEEHPERIQEERFDDWLEVIADKNVKQTIKLKIAEHPPITYQQCLAANSGYEKLLDLLEATLLTAPKDENKDKPLMSNHMEEVCNVLMESFLAVDSTYYNCHDAEIEDIEMINYFYSGHGMHCAAYCHRLLKHENGPKITYCKKLVDNLIAWWQEMRRLFAEGFLSKKTIDYLIGPGDVYQVINEIYRTVVGGKINANVDDEIMRNMQNYKMYMTTSPEPAVKHFFAHFIPSDVSQWTEDIKELKGQLDNAANYQSNVQRIMKTNWSLYAQHREFLEELLTHAGCATFEYFCNAFITTAIQLWVEPGGIRYETLDFVEMCLWLESRDWTKDEWLTIHQMQEVFVKENITGSTLNDAIQLDSDKITYFIFKMNTETHFDDDSSALHEVLESLFLEIEQNETFKWNGRYSIAILEVMYNVRIKPSWNVFCDELQQGQSKVYEVQKYFQLTPWLIDEEMIKEEISKILLTRNHCHENDDLIRNRIWRATKDVVNCLRCIESLSMLRIITDGVTLFQNICSGSKRYDGLKMDSDYQSLKEILDSVQEFDFYRRYNSSLDDAPSTELNETEMSCLNRGSAMTMAYLLDFWDQHQDSIGNIKCGHRALKWMFTLCSHDIFVHEFFTMFEDDTQCMDLLAFVLMLFVIPICFPMSIRCKISESDSKDAKHRAAHPRECGTQSIGDGHCIGTKWLVHE